MHPLVSDFQIASDLDFAGNPRPLVKIDQGQLLLHNGKLIAGGPGLFRDRMIRTAQFSPLENRDTGGDKQPDDGEPFAKYAMAFAAACLLTVSLVLLRKGINQSGGAGALVVGVAFPFFLSGIVLLGWIFGF
jgi:hypothetical protein